MQFNDTTNKNGLIQTCEFWTRHDDGDISGNTALLNIFTARINRGFDEIMPLLLSYSDHIRWDDTNHTDRPFGTLDIVSGQNDYTIAEDDNSLDILNLTKVRILEGANETEYRDLQRMYIDDDRAQDALFPNSSVSGTPTHWLEKGNTIYLYPNPNYAVSEGIQVFFEREQSYFDTSDTTKEPGIPKPFHELPALYASLDWVSVNRAEDGNLITAIRNRILKKEREIRDMISLRNPVNVRMGLNLSHHNS